MSKINLIYLPFTPGVRLDEGQYLILALKLKIFQLRRDSQDINCCFKINLART